MADANGDCYIQTDSDGNFSITGDYYANCNADTDIIYFEVIGGVAGATYNQNLALVALPSSTQNCGYYYNNPDTAFLVISDFTNVAAAFGAGTFATYTKSAAHLYDSIAAYPGDYAALGTVLDAVNNVTPSAYGYYQGSDANVQKQLNTLADVVAPCLDSTGATTPSSNCGQLFTQTTQAVFSGTKAPSTPFLALESMAQFPTNNVTNQYYLVTPTPPWLPNDTTVPTDSYYTSDTTSWNVPVNGSGQPIIYSLSSATPTHNVVGGTASITITGSFGTSTSPVVIGAGQNMRVTAATSGSITVTVPTHTSKGALGVYVNGVASNFVQFSIL